jgi:DUF4097 and DUF4098 domain-containing protein YvlB
MAWSALRARVLLVLPLAAFLAGCDVSLGHLTGRATDEWTRTYPLSQGGEVRIGNTNGRIDVEGVDGSTVEIRAERIARAATDEGAKELLPRISIKEDIQPDRVSIETDRMSGIMIGASYEVRYHVRAPKNAVVNVSNTNGLVNVVGLTGKVQARTTNGGVRGKDLSGPVDARTTNGGVNIELAKVSKEPITLRTTNGGVALYLPDDAKADVTATWTNGGVSYADLNLDVTEKSRRRLEARMNGGGAPIELHTTNGGIRIRSRSDAPSTKTDTGDTDRDREKDDSDSDVAPPKPPKPPKPPTPPSGERR